MSEPELEEIVTLASVAAAAMTVMHGAYVQNQNQVSERKVREKKENLGKNFHWLCQEGMFQEVEEALKSGVDVNSISKVSDQTGLMIAVRRRHNGIVRLLLQQTGVNIMWTNSLGHTAVTAAVEGLLIDKTLQEL